jgi:hypothetical protein
MFFQQEFPSILYVIKVVVIKKIIDKPCDDKNHPCSWKQMLQALMAILIVFGVQDNFAACGTVC